MRAPDPVTGRLPPAPEARFFMTSQPDSAADRGQNAALGIAFMLAGIFLFSVNDTLGKWLAGTYAAPQILLLRSVASLIILAPIVAHRGFMTLIRVERPWLQLLRAVIGSVEVMLFYWAVHYLPLADAMTYYLAGPIYVTVMAALFLGERVGWRRWAAVIAGFAGVVIALGPSLASFGWPSLIALAGSLHYAVFIVFTRVLRGTSDVVMAVWQLVLSVIVGAALSPLTWQPFAGWSDAALLLTLGIGSLGGIVLVNRSLTVAPASVVVPYQYTMIVWAALFGYLAFGDVPRVATLVGAAIIVAAGLFIYFREARVGGDVTPEFPPDR